MSQTSQPLDSISLDAFKAMNGISTITVVQGTGRMFADTAAGRLYFAEKVDLKKPLYVAKGEHDSYWVFNTSVRTITTL